jgi:hypothetical protein
VRAAASVLLIVVAYLVYEIIEDDLCTGQDKILVRAGIGLRDCVPHPLRQQ